LFELLALAADFLLISVDLLILLIGLIFAALQLVADDRSRAEAECSANGCARAGTTNGRTDKAAGCRAA
jgi:hypothetical protein